MQFVVNYGLIWFMAMCYYRAQVVGWPPVRSYRKNCFQAKKMEAETTGMYVKVSMDGAPYLRKIDLKIYKGYPELLKAMEDMFKFSVGKHLILQLIYKMSLFYWYKKLSQKISHSFIIHIITWACYNTKVERKYV